MGACGAGCHPPAPPDCSRGAGADLCRRLGKAADARASYERALRLTEQEPPSGFSVDRECELKAADESKAVVRYSRHPLDIQEVQAHIESGKQPTRVALTWNSRVSFVLTDALHIRKVAFLDVVFESATGGSTGKDNGFDVDVAIATAELAQLIPDLLLALDGETLGS